MVALLALADVVLANDTGPLHVAVALGRPVVAPYTCTQIAKHGPYGRSGAVATQVPCAGSYLKQCDQRICLDDLTPAQLWEPLHAAVQTWTRRSA
jgi:ADP-heptose:LPS heptosyltransferase